MSRGKRPDQLLSVVPIFEGLQKRDLARIMRIAKKVEFPEGREIVKEGSRGVGFHLILEGEAKVLIGGRKRASVRRGDFFGEMSLIDGGPRTATVVAATPVVTLSVSSWEFKPLLDRHPSIARAILVELCRRLRETDRSLTH